MIIIIIIVTKYDYSESNVVKSFSYSHVDNITKTIVPCFKDDNNQVTSYNIKTTLNAQHIDTQISKYFNSTVCECKHLVEVLLKIIINRWIIIVLIYL